MTVHDDISALWIRPDRLRSRHVREQRARVNTDALETPVENVYPCLPSSKIGADSWP